MKMLAVIFVAVAVVAMLTLPTAALPSLPSVAAHPCPKGWTYSSYDDSCSATWPRNNRSTSQNNLPTTVSYFDALHWCHLQGAELPVIIDITTQLAFYQNLIGTQSGRMWWLGVRADPSVVSPPQRWIVESSHRSAGFVFSWDTKRSMPGIYDDCVAMHQNGTGVSGRVFGGNGKMITIGCEERASVICTKQRVPVSITGTDGSLPRRLEFVEGSPLTITFFGNRIPNGTLVSLQSMTPDMVNLTLPEGAQTHCKRVSNLTGVHTPFVLIPDDTLTSSQRVCNGTCMTASITIPSTWPLVRGSQYSFCFFNPVPHFSTPNDFSEYQNEYLKGAFLEVVQNVNSFLSDVCAIRRQEVDVVEGTGKPDSQLPASSAPFVFESPIAGSLNDQRIASKTTTVPWGR
jgi:hypothetical protein